MIGIFARTWGAMIRMGTAAVVAACIVVSAQDAHATHVPPGAQGPGFPLHLSGTLLVQEIKDGLFWVTEGAYQTMFLVSGSGVILIDSPPSLMSTPDGSTLLGAIAQQTSQPITDLIYSHEHRDHIGGAAMVKAAFPNVRIWAHVETARTLARAHADNPNDSRVLPTDLVRKRKSIRVGHQVLELENRGTFHDPGDLFIYAPGQKVLMAVDIVFPGWVPFANLGLTKDVRGFINAHDEILTYDFEVFIGGHLTRTGTRADVEQSRAYIFAVMNGAARALQEIEFGAGAPPEDFPNPYALFDRFLADVTRRCAELVEPNFQHLGAIDIFTDSHCFTMQNFLRGE